MIGDAPAPAVGAPEGWQAPLERWGPSLLLALTAAAYAGVARAGLVWDDLGLVLGNPRLESLANVPSYFTGHLWAGVSAGDSGYYRPVFLSWLALVRAIFGESAAAWHLGGLMWHLVAVEALRRLLAPWLGARPALVGAAIFALHPLQSEAVIWVSAHNDTLAAALVLCALGLAAPGSAPGPARLVGAGALAALAALTKESAVLCPLMGAALQVARGGRPDRRVGALAAGVGLALAMRALAGVGTAPLPDASALRFALAQAPALAVTVLSWLLAPWPLCAARSIKWLEVEPVRAALAGVVVVALGLAAARPGPARAPVRVGLAWAGLTLAPTLLAVLSRGLVGERYLYLPMAGAAVAGAGLLGRLPWPALVAPAALATTLIALRVPDWVSPTSIWEAALRDAPSPYVHFGAAEALRERGQLEEALVHYAAALDGDPVEQQACVPALDLVLTLRGPEAAAGFAREAGVRGCDREAAFVGYKAVVLCFVGAWEEARAIVGAMRVPDPSGRADVVRAALARIDGRGEAWQAALGAWTGASPLEVQVGRLLRAGGRPDLAPSGATLDVPP